MIVMKYFRGAFCHKNYSLVKETHEYNGHLFENVAKWAKCMALHVMYARFKAPDLISILSHWLNIKPHATSMEAGNINHFLFEHFMVDPSLTAFAIRVCNIEDDYSQKEKYQHVLSGHELSARVVRKTQLNLPCWSRQNEH